MSSKKIIVVTGVTGTQGGAVAKALLATNKFTVHGLTRNPSSESAKSFQKLGVTLHKGDLMDQASIEAAFKGAYGAFLVTNYWEPYANGAEDTDYVHGKKLVDAAVNQKLQFVVWSSLPDVDKISGGKYKVNHFTHKNRVEEYIKSVGLPAAFVYAGFYVTNWTSKFLGPSRDSNGKVVIMSPLRADVGLPIIDIEADFGQFVPPIFEDPTRFRNVKVLVASEYVTVEQMAAAYTRVTGESVTIIPIPPEKLPTPELTYTILHRNNYGFFNGEYLQPSHSLYKSLNLHTFEDWLRRSRFRAQL